MPYLLHVELRLDRRAREAPTTLSSGAGDVKCQAVHGIPPPCRLGFIALDRGHHISLVFNERPTMMPSARRNACPTLAGALPPPSITAIAGAEGLMAWIISMDSLKVLPVIMTACA